MALRLSVQVLAVRICHRSGCIRKGDIINIALSLKNCFEFVRACHAGAEDNETHDRSQYYFMEALW